MRKQIFTQEDFQGIRDFQDALAASDEFFARLAQSRGETFKAPARVGGASRYKRNRVGANGNGSAGGNVALDDGCNIRRRGSNNGGPLSTDRDCDNPCTDIGQPCGADILGFHSLDASAVGFPLVSAAPGTLSVEGSIEVGPGLNCTRYTPRHVFFIGRDRAAAYGAVPALLTSAVISGGEQLAATGTRNAIPTDVFNLTEEPLPVNWSAFTTVQGSTLNLKFASYLGAGSAVDIFGAFWGDMGYAA